MLGKRRKGEEKERGKNREESRDKKAQDKRAKAHNPRLVNKRSKRQLQRPERLLGKKDGSAVSAVPAVAFSPSPSPSSLPLSPPSVGKKPILWRIYSSRVIRHIPAVPELQELTAPPKLRHSVAICSAHNPNVWQARCGLRSKMEDKARRRGKVRLKTLNQQYYNQMIIPSLISKWLRDTREGSILPPMFDIQYASFVTPELAKQLNLWGLFSLQDLPAGSFLGVYTGEKYTQKQWESQQREKEKEEKREEKKESKSLRLDLSPRSSYVFEVNDKLLVDGYNGGYLRFMNASCMGEEDTVNVLLIPWENSAREVFVLAYSTKPIRAGDELLTWYSDEFCWTRYDLQLRLQGIDVPLTVLRQEAKDKKWSASEFYQAYDLLRSEEGSQQYATVQNSFRNRFLASRVEYKRSL